VTQSNMDEPPKVAVHELPGTHVGQFVLGEGTVITEPPDLLAALDVMTENGGGCLFCESLIPPAVLIGLAGEEISTYWRDREEAIPIMVRFGPKHANGLLVVVIDLTIFDTLRRHPLVATAYVNPYDSASHEALCQILQAEQVQVLALDGHTVRRRLNVSLNGQLNRITKDFLIDMVPKLAAPPQAAWLAALAKVRADWERTTGDDHKENQ